MYDEEIKQRKKKRRLRGFTAGRDAGNFPDVGKTSIISFGIKAGAEGA